MAKEEHQVWQVPFRVAVPFNEKIAARLSAPSFAIASRVFSLILLTSRVTAVSILSIFLAAESWNDLALVSPL